MKVIRYYLHMKGTWGERFIRKYFKKNYIDKINNYLDELEILYYTTELCYKKKISHHYLNELFNPPVYSDNMLYLFRDHIIFLPLNYDFNNKGNIVSMLISKYVLLSELIFVFYNINFYFINRITRKEIIQIMKYQKLLFNIIMELVNLNYQIIYSCILIHFNIQMICIFYY